MPQEPLILREVVLSASAISAPTKSALLLSLTSENPAMFTWARWGIREGNQAQQPRYFPGSSAAHVLSLNFETMKLQTAPEEFGTQAVARLLSSLFHSE